MSSDSEASNYSSSDSEGIIDKRTLLPYTNDPTYSKNPPSYEYNEDNEYDDEDETSSDNEQESSHIDTRIGNSNWCTCGYRSEERR